MSQRARDIANDITLQYGHVHFEVCESPAKGPVGARTVCGCGIGARQLALRDAIAAALATAEAESEGRRRTLLEVRAEQVEDWKRAERAEAEAGRLRAALGELWTQAIEAAALVACGRCGRGEPMRDGGHFVRDGLEPKGSDGRWVPCYAKRIRAALPPSQPPSGEE